MTRTVHSVRNPKWANNARTWIDLEVNFAEEPEEYVDFTATADDPEPHGVSLYERAVAGEFGTISDFVPPATITGENAMSSLRIARDALLAATDYIEMPTKWATFTAEQQTAWATYRNALRDIPSNNPSAELVWNLENEGYEWHNVVWPTKPE